MEKKPLPFQKKAEAILGTGPNEAPHLEEIKRENNLPMGASIADSVAATVGSWPFILVQTSILLLWIILNSAGWFFFHWDIYPFILLNLCLSFQAAYTGPFVLMSQNRQAAKDRLMVEHDYETNRRAEQENRILLEHIDVIHRILEETKHRTFRNTEHLVALRNQDNHIAEVQESLERLERHVQELEALFKGGY